MDAEYNIVDPSNGAVSEYKTGFAACISRAIDLGFQHIYISPMVSHCRAQRVLGHDTYDTEPLCR
jgi:hypothetical protein